MANNNLLLKKFQIDRRFYLCIYQGNLSPLDIRIKYKDVFCNKKIIKERTPKHIHWVCDILIKRSKQPILTKQLIAQLLLKWEKIEGWKNQKSRNKALNISRLWNKQWEQYNKLDGLGEYSAKFLIIFLQLLMYQEKTNNPNAYFFSSVLGLLQEEPLQLWDIISKATHR